MTNKTLLAAVVSMAVISNHFANAQALTFPLEGVGLEIMNANPFLRTGVGQVPPLKTKMVTYVGLEHEKWKEPIASVTLVKCVLGIAKHLGLSSDRKPLCLEIGVRGAINKYEENYSKVRVYQGPLFTNTPRIQRIYDLNPGVTFEMGEYAMRLIATIDEQGNVTPASTLIKVGSGGRVTEMGDGAAAGGSVIPMDGGNRATTANPGQVQQPALLNCASISNFVEKAKCFANAAGVK